MIRKIRIILKIPNAEYTVLTAVNTIFYIIFFNFALNTLLFIMKICKLMMITYVKGYAKVIRVQLMF